MPCFVAKNIFVVYIRWPPPKRKGNKDAEHGQSEMSMKLTELVVLIEGGGELASESYDTIPANRAGKLLTNNPLFNISRHL